jgi:hypothetical protein
MPFGLPGRGTANDHLRAQYKRRPFTRQFSVSIRPLDEARREEHLPPPDLMKIDVEGYELEVLRGAAATLRECRPALFVEVHGLTPERRLSLAREVIAFVRATGDYAVVHVESGERIPDEKNLRAFEGHLWCC